MVRFLTAAARVPAILSSGLFGIVLLKGKTRRWPAVDMRLAADREKVREALLLTAVRLPLVNCQRLSNVSRHSSCVNPIKSSHRSPSIIRVSSPALRE